MVMTTLKYTQENTCIDNDLHNFMAKISDFQLYTYRGKKIYEPPRYMSVNQAAQQLLEIVQNRRLQGEEPGTEDPEGKGSCSFWLLG